MSSIITSLGQAAFDKGAAYAGAAIGGAATAGLFDAATAATFGLTIMEVFGEVALAGTAASGIIAAAPIAAPVAGAGIAYGATKAISAIGSKIFCG